MNLTALIESAELRYKQVLEDFFVSVYDEKNLLSHGLDHHRRVWLYAKSLLSIPIRKYNSIASCSPSKLIIACYLHDIGMSVDPGPRHGRQSRELCLRFLDRNNLSESDYQDVLETIENHDRKEYISEKGRDDLLTILSAADDLDAFGFTGIYRYCEIYLTRGLSPLQIGHLILENAKWRYDNLGKVFGSHNLFVRQQRKRYEILRDFFIHYNEMADTYNFQKDDPEGYGGVIQLFIMFISEKRSFEEFFAEAEIYRGDIIIEPFLNGLRSELSSNYQNEQR